MRSAQVVGYIDILLGVLAFIIPIKFYAFGSGLFTISPPPFSLRIIQLITVVLFIPAGALILNGIALLLLIEKVKRLPEMKVYSDAGEYMGEVEGVEVEGESVRSLELERGVKVPKEDLSGVDDVVVVKKRKGKKKTKHHFVGKEVFTELGEFIGRVEDVELDELGEIVKLEAAKGSATRIIAKDDIVGSNGVIMIKAEKEE